MTQENNTYKIGQLIQLDKPQFVGLVIDKAISELGDAIYHVYWFPFPDANFRGSLNWWSTDGLSRYAKVISS